MRNLKKILALALSLVMMLSVMSVASAKSLGDYTDAGSVSAQHAVAVDVATQLGVLRGMTETEYAPQGTLTRAQLATMIYRITTGDVTDTYVKNFAGGGSAKFSDVSADAWYAGYVAYCADSGYLQGMGDGTYAPYSALTGYQALAALLRAIGYNQPGQFTGADWTVQVASYARETGVSGTVVADLNQPITREQAAQFVYNALFTTMVEHTPAFGYQPTRAAYDTLAESVFKVATGKAGEAHQTIDVWGRPATVWYSFSGAKLVVITEKAAAKYNVAVSDCEIAAAMGLKSVAQNGYYAFWNNGYETETYIDVTGQAKNNGAQGTQIEVYSDRVLQIDTFLAQAGLVHPAVVDGAGHVVKAAYADVTVFESVDYCYALDLTTMADTSYVPGTMILVNVNYTLGVVAVQAAESFVGAQTTHYINAAKHEVNGTVYADAKHFHLNPALTNPGNWTWYLDQFGNLIGNAQIVDPSSYAVIKSIQWINPVSANGYAQAVLVDMDGNETTEKIYSIDGDTLYYGSYYGADWDRGDKAEVSTNIKENYSVYCGLDLYEITTLPNGYLVLNQVDDMIDVDVVTGVPVIGNQLVDDTTKYLVRVDNADGTYSFETVTGYNKIGTYTGDTVVDYVHIDADGIADYIYLIGTPDSVFATSFVFFTDNTNVAAVLSPVGGYSYYVINNVVFGDGTVGKLYIADTDLINRAMVEAWVNDSVGKLFKIDSIDGFIGDMYDEIEEVVGWTSYGDDYAVYSGKVTTIGANMIATDSYYAWNTTSSTIYVNATTGASLKVGDCIYVIGSYVNGVYVADIVFITNNDVEANVLAAAKAAAKDDLEAYAAEVVAEDGWGQAADVTADDLKTVLAAELAKVDAATVDTLAEVEAQRLAGREAIWAAALAAQAEYDADAAAVALKAAVKAALEATKVVTANMTVAEVQAAVEGVLDAVEGAEELAVTVTLPTTMQAGEIVKVDVETVGTYLVVVQAAAEA